MRYYSTNHNSPSVSFKEALLQGLAPDRGLYLPEKIPMFPSSVLSSLGEIPYHEIAFLVLQEFLKDEVPEEILRRMTQDAYDFLVPIQEVTENIYLLRLDQGPTASFKDFGARMLARLMGYFRRGEKKNLLVLVATSGDTGGAIANAFCGVEGISVVILFPANEVNLIQRRQMTTLGNNIQALAVDGKFDDCQAMVKEAFGDEDMSRLSLTSANSIDVGRLLPQTVYYFSTYGKLQKKEEELVFSVPSGNFGNLMAGLIAKKMGLPISRCIAATNENDEFPRFLKTGVYRPIVPSRACLSNAMNVGHPSNLARIIALYGGSMNERGDILRKPNLQDMRQDIWALSVSDRQTKRTMQEVYERYGIVLEPHGAVGFAALEKYLSEKKDTPLAISIETAHPAKFPREIEEILKLHVEAPESIKRLEGKEEVIERIPPSYESLKKFLLARY